MDREFFYLLMICSLLIVPRILQRFRIPAPLTCMLLGLFVALVFPSDGRIVHFAAVLGISSLFLFAGLEVRFSVMRRHAGALAVFGLLRLTALAATTFIAQHLFDIALQPACLIALALLTSSTGFILDSLDQFGIEGEDRELIGTEAILGEILGLTILFFVLQSTDGERFVLATATLVLLLIAIPLLLHALVRWVLPHAPESEFSLLVLASIVAGFVTERLGVEYLLGAFITGVAVSQMSKKQLLLESPHAMFAIKLFSSFFLPFYFFRSGEQLAHEALSVAAISTGLLFSMVVPLRWAVVWLRYRLGGGVRGREAKLSLSLLPTLIFTLVLSQILRSRFDIDAGIVSGLVIYALVSTLVPSLLLHRREPVSQTIPAGSDLQSK